MAKTAKTEQEEPLKVKLWKAADKLRKNMDAAEYKHVALGLIFLKYISDAFEVRWYCAILATFITTAASSSSLCIRVSAFRPTSTRFSIVNSSR